MAVPAGTAAGPGPPVPQGGIKVKSEMRSFDFPLLTFAF